jgi:hypothetical protein
MNHQHSRIHKLESVRIFLLPTYHFFPPLPSGDIIFLRYAQ